MSEARTILLDTDTRKDRAVDAVRSAPPDHECVIRKRRHQRSLAQNNLIWAVFTEIGKPLGYSKKEVHDLALKDYAGSRVIRIGDVEVEVLNKTTSGMTVEEMSTFIDWLTPWGVDLGCDVRYLRRVHRV